MDSEENGIKASIERHKLSDGSVVDDVMIRWNGGCMKLGAYSKEHARRLLQEIQDTAHIEIATWPEGSPPPF